MFLSLARSGDLWKRDSLGGSVELLVVSPDAHHRNSLAPGDIASNWLGNIIALPHVLLIDWMSKASNTYVLFLQISIGIGNCHWHLPARSH
jgi:hypothetical protein